MDEEGPFYIVKINSKLFLNTGFITNSCMKVTTKLHQAQKFHNFQDAKRRVNEFGGKVMRVETTIKEANGVHDDE